MNIHQLKQMWQQNLWYGENVRLRSADTPRLTGALIQPDYTRIWGPDISGRWDGIVDLSVTKAMGASFVFIKGVDGAIPTRYYKENYSSAVSTALPEAPYAWLYRDINVNAKQQAQALHDLNQKYPPQLPSVIDFESTKFGGIQSNPNFSDLRKWATEWLRLGNPKALLYSGKYYMNDYGPGEIPNDLQDMFAGLWIAQYNGGTPPSLPLGWTGWTYHQFSAQGDAQLIAPGNLGKLELDLNYAAKAITQPPPTGDPITNYGKVKTFTNIRNSPPGGTYQDIGDLLTGDLVTADEIRLVSGYNWWHLKSITRNGQTVLLPGSECWAYGVNIETLPPPVVKPVSMSIELATGSKVTTVYSDGSQKVETA